MIENKLINNINYESHILLTKEVNGFYEKDLLQKMWENKILNSDDEYCLNVGTRINDYNEVNQIKEK